MNPLPAHNRESQVILHDDGNISTDKLYAMIRSTRSAQSDDGVLTASSTNRSCFEPSVFYR